MPVVSRPAAQREMGACMRLMQHVGVLCNAGSYFYSFTPVSCSCQAGKVFRCFLRYVTAILWTLLSAWSQSSSLIRRVSAQSLPLSQPATCFCLSQIKSVWTWDSACQKRPPQPSITTFFPLVTDVIVEAAWGRWWRRGPDAQRPEQVCREETSGAPRCRKGLTGVFQREPERFERPQDASEAVRKRRADCAASFCGESRSDPEGGLSHVSKESRGTSRIVQIRSNLDFETRQKH